MHCIRLQTICQWLLTYFLGMNLNKKIIDFVSSIISVMNKRKARGRTATILIIAGMVFIISYCGSPEAPKQPNSQQPDSLLGLNRITSTANFAYYFDGNGISQIQAVIDALEANHGRIISDLGPVDMPVVRAMIWSDEDEFNRIMWAHLGHSYTGVTGYVDGPDELRILLKSGAPQTAVHEFVHNVSLNLNRNIGNNPRWLWETVAVYESQGFTHPNTLHYMASGDYPTLEELNTSTDPGREKVYEVGYILGEYIIVTWGIKALRELILQFGDLSAVLGISASEFESDWYTWVRARYFADYQEN